MAITINGNGTVTGLSVGGLPDGCVDRDTLAASTKPAYVSFAVLQDQKAHDVSGGGTASNGAWRTRDLNTEVTDADGIVLGFNNISTSTAKLNGTNWSLTSNANGFVLGAGTYVIKWRCSAYYVDRNQAELYNNTDSAIVGVASSEYAQESYPVTSKSHGVARVTISGNKEFLIRMRVEDTKTTYGWGVDSGFDTEHKSIYTTVEILKEAS